jgi:hypothetical protein
MFKNFAIVCLLVLLAVGSVSHKRLQDTYKKTCASSVKKSERIGELFRELKAR